MYILLSNYYQTGIYVVHKRILDYIVIDSVRSQNFEHIVISYEKFS